MKHVRKVKRIKSFSINTESEKILKISILGVSILNIHRIMNNILNTHIGDFYVRFFPLNL